MKIIRISIRVGDSGVKESVFDYECKKTKAGYVVERESNFGGKTTFVKNAEILLVDTMLNNSASLIERYTWCFEETLSQARQLVIDSLIKKAEYNYNNSKSIYEYSKTLK